MNNRCENWSLWIVCCWNTRTIFASPVAEHGDLKQGGADAWDCTSRYRDFVHGKEFLGYGPMTLCSVLQHSENRPKDTKLNRHFRDTLSHPCSPTCNKFSPPNHPSTPGRQHNPRTPHHAHQRARHRLFPRYPTNYPCTARRLPDRPRYL